MATGEPDPTPAARRATAQQLAAAFARSRGQREDAAALKAEAGQARRRARALRGDSNAILGSAAALIETELADRGILLAEPVAARFQTDENGSCGIEITVALQDPTRAAVARSVIAERVGGESPCDSLVIV